MLQQRSEAKYARKKVFLDRVSNSQPPGYESDTTEPPRLEFRDLEEDIDNIEGKMKMMVTSYFTFSYNVFYSTERTSGQSLFLKHHLAHNPHI